MSQYLFRLPFSDIGGTMMTHQNHDKCADFEMRYVVCMEAYGFDMGTQKCTDFRSDFDECVLRHKQIARIAIMQAERKRQVKAGEAQYAEPPVQHIFKDYTFYY